MIEVIVIGLSVALFFAAIRNFASIIGFIVACYLAYALGVGVVTAYQWLVNLF